MKIPGSCCKECRIPEEIRSQCSYGGKVYEASIAQLFSSLNKHKVPDSSKNLDLSLSDH